MTLEGRKGWSTGNASLELDELVHFRVEFDSNSEAWKCKESDHFVHGQSAGPPVW